MFFQGGTNADRPLGTPRVSRLDPASAPPPPRPDWGPAAPLWRRIVARAADMLAVLFIQWALVVVQVFWFMDDLTSALDVGPWGRALAATLVYTVLWAIYDVVFIRYNKGQTPGKDWMKVRVVRWGDGETPTAAQAFVRWLPFGLARLVPPVWLGTVLPAVTMVSMPLDSHQRGLHDHLAGTVVVAFDRDEADAADPNVKPMPSLREVRKGVRQKYGLMHHLGFDKLFKLPGSEDDDEEHGRREQR